MPDLTTYNWRQLSPATPPGAISWPGMVWIGDRVFLFGGSRLGILDETWEMVGDEWSQLSPATTPPARVNQAIGWDGSRVLMFGGLSSIGTHLLDTWEYSGGDWNELFPATSPTDLFDEAMVWDSVGNRFVMQGQGSIGPPEVAETWEYASADWNQLSPANQPEQDERTVFVNGRVFITLVADGGVVTLWSGSASGDPDSAVIPDPPSNTMTWDFASGDWTKFLGATDDPNPRAMSCAAHDGTEMLIFGGTEETFGFNDTWYRLGSDWFELSPATSPSARYGMRMVFDPTLQRFVMFGGSTGETWVFEPPEPPPAATGIYLAPETIG